MEKASKKDAKVWKRTLEALDEVEADTLRGVCVCVCVCVCVSVGVDVRVHHCLRAHLS